MKHYLIAGLRVAMDTYGRTAQQARSYQTEEAGTPDITVTSLPEQLHKEQPHLSLDDCEYLSTSISFYTQLLEHDGMMLHASCVAVDGRAYLFAAPSGTGKSTHTELWLKQFGGRAYILNDDKPALRFENGMWYAYGTPWSGKYDISRNARVPVAGIAVVTRGQTNEIQPFAGVEAIGALMAQVMRPKDGRYRALVLELMDKLISKVPIWKLKCNMEPEAAIVSYEAMSGAKKENEK